MNSLDAEPMMSVDKFIEQTGLSAVTVWRYRKKGMLTTVIFAAALHSPSGDRAL